MIQLNGKNDNIIIKYITKPAKNMITLVFWYDKSLSNNDSICSFESVWPFFDGQKATNSDIIIIIADDVQLIIIKIISTNLLKVNSLLESL